MSLSLLILGASGCRQAHSEAAIPLRVGGINPKAIAQIYTITWAQMPHWNPADGAIPITLYRLDSQCQDYLAETVLVDPEQPITDAISYILRHQDIIAFDLSGYRVSRSADGATVTIDFRLDPDSQRRLTSLADCEQKALFGSLRQTLAQPAWNIQQVQFTQRGEPLLL
ncbi:hypothetical protein C7293_31420 [filamentous cyanobacterium CCT1]|nr:hypothetical protein C7293_31420 [filamentous cyanobacterium CCT1]